MDKRISASIDENIVNELRNTVVFLQGPPLFLSVKKFMEVAIIKELDHLKRAYNFGKDFEKVPAAPRRGRPVGG